MEFARRSRWVGLRLKLKLELGELQDAHRDHEIQLELLDWVYRLKLDSIASSSSRDTIFQGRRFKFDKFRNPRH
jgi:hypothetical protein